MWRMEDVLDLYEEPYDPNKPVVCFDELPYQMVAEKRTPLPHPKAWTPAALRLRVRAQGYAQHLRVLRAQERMAASGH